LSRNLRNTVLLLIIVLILILAGIFFVSSHYNKKIETATKQISELEQKLDQIPQLSYEIEAAESALVSYQLRLSQLDKTIKPELAEVAAYCYLDSIQDKFGFLKCTITFEEDSTLAEYSYLGFSIKGESYFSVINNFVWALENGPNLYKIKTINLRSVEELDEETGETMVIVIFEMKIWALYAKVENLPPIQNSLAAIPYQELRINPFYPYFTQHLTPNIDKLPEVERSELKVILPDQIIISDAQNNLLSLYIGDEVYLGYLTRINPEERYAEFTLNKGGIISTFRLTLTFNGKEKQ